MKKRLKTAFAALIGTAACFAGASITASADASLTDDGTLTLSGDITREELTEFCDNKSVTEIVCEDNAVFPEDCTSLFEYGNNKHWQKGPR